VDEELGEILSFPRDKIGRKDDLTQHARAFLKFGVWHPGRLIE
jgi:hypothetical protein